MPKPPTDASHDDHLEFIHYQLDCITETSGVVLNGLVMLGDRAQGGKPSLLIYKHEEYVSVSSSLSQVLDPVIVILWLTDTGHQYAVINSVMNQCVHYTWCIRKG